MPTRTRWVISTSSKSHCGRCDGYLDMLTSDNDLSPSNTNPWFWICWKCHRVCLVGVEDGDVRREG